MWKLSISPVGISYLILQTLSVYIKPCPGAELGNWPQELCKREKFLVEPMQNEIEISKISSSSSPSSWFFFFQNFLGMQPSPDSVKL